MTKTNDPRDRAAELRSHGIFAARAGRLEEARAAFGQALEADPDHAGTYLWLASVAPSEREAYRTLEAARGLIPDPAHLQQAAEHIHQIFRRGRHPAVPTEEPEVATGPSAWVSPTVPPIPPAAESGAMAAEQPAGSPVSGQEEVAPGPVVVVPGPTDRRAAGMVRALATGLRFLGRLVALAVAIVALVALVSLLITLGQRGGDSSLPVALRQAANLTGEYLGGLSRGDMGTLQVGAGSRLERPVLTELARALPLSLGLLAASLALAVVIGLALGAAASLRRGGRLSGLLIFGSVLGISTPSYFAAMLLIWLVVWIYQRTGQHVLPISGAGWNAHLVLPALVLAARPAATVTRLSYNSLVEIFEAEYIRTARSKGLRRGAVLFRHALRNAWVPISTTIVASLRFTLAALPIVEYIFSWPGIGQQLLESIQLMDTTGVIGMALPLVVLFSLVNLSLETLYPLVDPRLRNLEKGMA
jgi:ABC-type dipeptide/oligopeptide/nickel transport system permease component